MTPRYFALAGAVTTLEVTDLGTMMGVSDVIFQIIDGLTLAAQVEVKVIKLATLMVDRLLGISKAAMYVIELLAQEHRGGAYCLEFMVECLVSQAQQGVVNIGCCPCLPGLCFVCGHADGCKVAYHIIDAEASFVAKLCHAVDLLATQCNNGDHTHIIVCAQCLHLQGHALVVLM